MKKVIVQITKQAKVTVEADGFQGESCLTGTHRTIQSLGKKGDETAKPELFETESETQSLTEKQ